MYTASSILLKTLRDAGITHAFVNWGSDHPALLEDLQRQKQSGEPAQIDIITCPNEMVALSAAHGFAAVSGKPAVVLVHVDVGTQALAGAVHNADRGRVPVLIYAGAAPSSMDSEVTGSRNEYMFWLQDIPDQSAIVRQYMRFVSQISSSKNVDKVVLRALQWATSDPKGPVYLWARREIMEEEVAESVYSTDNRVLKWAPLGQVTIPTSAAHQISLDLINAKRPLIITSYLGREPGAVSLLTSLSEMLAVPVQVSCPSSLSFPQNHPHFAGVSYGTGENILLEDADFVLVLDSDVPWVNQHNQPQSTAKIYRIDVDVLKAGVGMSHIGADESWKASSTLALRAILNEASEMTELWNVTGIEARRNQLASAFTAYSRRLEEAERSISCDGTFTVPNLIAVLRDAVPNRTLFINESITNFPSVWAHLKPSRPGCIITSGSSSLGFSLGASIGASLAIAAFKGEPRQYTEENDFICAIVGDGSFMFGIPSSAFWIARKYKTPFLTVILNNGGWKAPRMSLLGVHPTGLASKVSGQELHISFGPETPDYTGVAAAAGNAWGRKVELASQLVEAVKDAIRVVKEEKRCAVLDCRIEVI